MPLQILASGTFRSWQLAITSKQVRFVQKQIRGRWGRDLPEYGKDNKEGK